MTYDVIRCVIHIHLYMCYTMCKQFQHFIFHMLYNMLYDMFERSAPGFIYKNEKRVMR